MDTIHIINKIAADRQKAKDMTNKAQKNKEKNNRTFADVLQEELDKLKGDDEI
ncbi:hypothetical protein [uncultured Clostridium sp.]|uniref:hypothetical protein n=1 Tax=uncultured Clostridium sp. TaxID=59620 RepID=UPI0028EE0EC3|nr:hypothetical protein [uncultured Clostridium sp.]